MAVIRGIEPGQAEQLARSRNQSTSGRLSRNIIDVYMSRGQCIARLWPTQHITAPTPAYLKTVEAIKREREIEKFINNDDRIALKIRARQSRYNWWEVLGKIYISREYHHPGSSVACSLVFIRYYSYQNRWKVRIKTDKPCYPFISVIHRDHYPRPGHYWYDCKHREAGLENILRGCEAWNEDGFIQRTQSFQGATIHDWLFSSISYPKQSVFKIVPCVSYHNRTVLGESGIYILTTDRPWWLNAPVPP